MLWRPRRQLDANFVLAAERPLSRLKAAQQDLKRTPEVRITRFTRTRYRNTNIRKTESRIVGFELPLNLKSKSKEKELRAYQALLPRRKVGWKQRNNHDETELQLKKIKFDLSVNRLMRTKH